MLHVNITLCYTTYAVLSITLCGKTTTVQAGLKNSDEFRFFCLSLDKICIIHLINRKNFKDWEVSSPCTFRE